MDANLNAPLSTYRLQFNAGFRFEDARRIVPYLAELGIGWMYASPYFKARPGSTHGYDVVDHNRLNPEVGTDAEHRALIADLHGAGLGHIVDFVPNHMGIGPDNPWWTDVLRFGRLSPYASFFDIDWYEHDARRAQVVLPFLGDHYGRIVERGELGIAFDPATGRFALTYFDHRFPLAPRTVAPLLRDAVPELAGDFEALRGRRKDGLRRGAIRERAFALEAELARRCAEDAALASAITAAAERIARDPDRLDAIVEAQSYRVAFWRVASDEINYRRFFDINDLAGLRVEDAETLVRTHELLFRMISDGRVQGVRIDHVDGLYNPGGYCNLLVDRASALGHPLYLVVEKILAEGERLRPSWRIAGTTGYDFMNQVLGVFVAPQTERFFERLYERVTRGSSAFDDVVYDAKQRVMRLDLSSELQVLSESLARIAKRDRRSNDFTANALRRALREVVASFPVYRTYVVSEDVDEDDRAIIRSAVARGRERSELPDPAIFDFIEETLTAQAATIPDTRYQRTEVLRFAMRFQQYTAPVTAKSTEDTAFYRYVRLIALNEVGGDPAVFGRTPAEFHTANAERARTHPHAMLATATHDHKRGEDTRLRIAALTEFPAEWSRSIARWSRMNEPLRDGDGSQHGPSHTAEYVFYQTLVGTLPMTWLEGSPAPDAEHADYVERIAAYALKAAREAKLFTSWTDPAPKYEEQLDRFVRGALERDGAFFRDLVSFTAQVAPVAAVHGLAQTALKLTAPGVPDIYQGCELWDLSLVDPDNRRPVDYELRRRVLAEFAERGDRERLIDELHATWHDGRIKMYATWQLLALRRERPATFLGRDYRPLAVRGLGAEHLMAFARDEVVVVTARLARQQTTGNGLRVAFADERVVVEGDRTYRNVLDDRLHQATGGTLAVADLLGTLPVAVLVPAPSR